MNWVKSFVECSVDHMWLTLRERLEADIREYGERCPASPAIHLTFDEPRIVLSRRRDKPPYDSPWATLERIENHLLLRTGASAHSREVEEMRLVPAVNFEGECRLMRGGKELELWQVSRLILEPLLVR